MSAMTIRRVIVRGVVQGVGFRAFVEDEAAMLGLEGWVRNRRDGSVEALFAGPGEAVARMIDLCRQGPETARVDSVDVHEALGQELALRRPDEHFSVLLTA
jgi:acylphosphatase